MSPAQMKEAIRKSGAYGAQFLARMDRMPDKQVAAIYNRLLSAGKLKEKK